MVKQINLFTSYRNLEEISLRIENMTMLMLIPMQCTRKRTKFLNSMDLRDLDVANKCPLFRRIFEEIERIAF